MSKKIDYDELMQCYQMVQSVITRYGLMIFLKEMPEQLHQILFKPSGLKKNVPNDYHNEKKKVW